MQSASAPFIRTFRRFNGENKLNREMWQRRCAYEVNICSDCAIAKPNGFTCSPCAFQAIVGPLIIGAIFSHISIVPFSVDSIVWKSVLLFHWRHRRFLLHTQSICACEHKTCTQAKKMCRKIFVATNFVAGIDVAAIIQSNIHMTFGPPHRNANALQCCHTERRMIDD